MGRIVKRLFDILFALLVNVFAIPIIIVFMIVVKIASPESPVIFKQERIGYKGKPFKEHKNITACKPFTEKEIKVA